jgi:transposase
MHAGQFRKAQGRKAKTDKIDARAIAAILTLGDHKRLSIPEPTLDNLRELTRFRVDLLCDVDYRIARLLHDLFERAFVARLDGRKYDKAVVPASFAFQPFSAAAIAFVFGSMAMAMTGSGEVHRLEHDRVFLVADGVDKGNPGDLLGDDLVDLLAREPVSFQERTNHRAAELDRA